MKPLTESDLPEGVTFINANREHMKNPRTFEVPSATDKAGIAVGDHVKIGVRFETRQPSEFAIQGMPVGTPLTGERFWVKIMQIPEPGTFIGEVDYDKMMCYRAHQLKGGMLVQFKAHHLLMTLTKQDQQRASTARN